MKAIELTMDKFALIDDEDHPKISGYNWSVSEVGVNSYAASRPKEGTVYMHRVIIGAQKGQEVDHINGNGLDNRKANLRFCTRSQNNQNQRKRPNLTSKYKGVSRHKNAKKWQVHIKGEHRQIWLGNFDTEQEAACVYNNAAIEIFGEFARLNKIA